LTIFDELCPSHTPESTASIHRKRDFQKPDETVRCPMLTESHRSHNRRKLLKVLMLGGQEGRLFKERDYVLQQVTSPSDNINQSTVLPSVGLNIAASIEPIAYQPQYLRPVIVLTDMELRNQLIPVTTRWVAIDGDRKAALAIYIARDVAIQPFLLIVRTRHIFTVTPDSDGIGCTSSAGYSEFPAYSRIYRQQRNLLSHDVLNPARVPL
jgi:hypothetical protein